MIDDEDDVVMTAAETKSEGERKEVKERKTRTKEATASRFGRTIARNVATPAKSASKVKDAEKKSMRIHDGKSKVTNEAKILAASNVELNALRFWQEANSSDAYWNKGPSGLGEVCSPLCQDLDRTY